MNRHPNSNRWQQVKTWLSSIISDTIANLIAPVILMIIGYLSSQWHRLATSYIPQILLWSGGFLAVVIILVWVWRYFFPPKPPLPPRLKLNNSLEEPWLTRLDTLQMLCRIGYYAHEGQQALNEGRWQEASSLFTKVLQELSSINSQADALLSTIVSLQKQSGYHYIAWSETRLDPYLGLEEISVQLQEVGDVRLPFSINIVDKLRQALSGMETIYQQAVQARQKGAWRRAAILFKEITGYRDASDELRQALSGMEAIYQQAVQARQKGAWRRAAILFKEITGYRDASRQLAKLTTWMIGGPVAVVLLTVIMTSQFVGLQNISKETPVPYSTTTSEPTPIPIETYTPIPTQVSKVLIRVDQQDYEASTPDPIEVKAGNAVRIEIILEDANGQPLKSGLAEYEWTFAPIDPENEQRLGNLSNVLNYNVPTDRQGQHINLTVTTAEHVRKIVIQLAIQGLPES